MLCKRKLVASSRVKCRSWLRSRATDTNAQPGEGKLRVHACGEHQMQVGRQMTNQEEHGLSDGLILDYMVVIQDEDNFVLPLPDLIEQGCQGGRERRRLGRVQQSESRLSNLGQAGAQSCDAEAQKRIGSLSNASRESQATSGSSLSALSTPRCEEDAAHAESSVVFPLPAGAETSVNG